LRANDAVVGLVLILFAAAMIAVTLGFPAFRGQNYGPALFPRILGTGLIVCGLVLMWNGIVARRAGAPWVTLASWVYDPVRVTSFLLVIAMLLLYILLSETVGFIPIAIVFLGGLFLWLGVKPLPAAVISVVSTLLIHWFFATMLRVPLPRGWLTEIL
jgi:putative tricarboxylic transport membrane protein